MPTDLSVAYADFLSFVEQEEVKLLAWGVVNGSFLEEELRNLADGFLASRPKLDISVQELVDALIERGLLFRVSQANPQYRSRMAEAVRLFANLRQILHGKPWQTAPTLVADYRFAIRPRVYPRRDIPQDAAFGMWREAGVLSSQRQQMLEAALSGDRAGFKLARFQVRATSRMLQDLDEQRSRGMIVTVGTGSGKTLAFYLPALAHLATLVRSGEYWTKAVAIYPRNELLKDQFAEAYDECRRYDQQLEQLGRRKLTIGAFFGPTSRNADPGGIQRLWKRHAQGFVCPFLRCPSCGEDLVWKHQDISAKTERLSCVATDCTTAIGPDEVMLTRERMRVTPPDVLFTTTETLNRRLGDTTFQHVFGVAAQRKPQLVLLDEVHTYVGATGAQAALLLRRWRHAIGTRLHFCGLSATLRNAGGFFGTLTGLGPSAIDEITPAPADVEASGMEYLLALRSDPASRVAVLSTSIQAAMLLGRILDTRKDPISGGLYGSKVFAFADTLDVINRFYHNLLDAEGWNGSGTAPRPQGSLAAHRSRVVGDHAARFSAGQSWRIAEEIGHPEGLRAGLRIGRTSSQDTGVDDQSQVLVATASLEVGFNDSSVGAVLQHKAPRDVASFLQRKGRAGRVRTMRPWTVVVLSDFGRDRLAYQGYEALFDPELPPRTLPVANRYVLRMQAVYSLMEWVAQRIGSSAPRGSVFDDFAGPASTNGYDNGKRKRQGREIELLERLLSGDGGLLASLQRHLRSALQLDDEVVAALLWEPPRAVLTAAVPTILRRLKSGWQRIPLRAGETPKDPTASRLPLPDFVPENLFSDLNLPEVLVVTPEWNNERQDHLPIVQALDSLSPGAVTRRFAVAEARANHWIPIQSLELPEQKMPIQATCHTYEEAGTFEVWEHGEKVSVRCVRPLIIHPTRVPAQVLPSSNAEPTWRSQLIPSGTGMSFDLPEGSAWQRLLRGLTFYVHNLGAAVEVRRFSIGSSPTILFRSGQEFRPKIRYLDPDTQRPAAIGFSEPVDGVVFRCTLPDDLHLMSGEGAGPKLRGLRTAYFRHLVITDDVLGEYAAYFQLERLQETYLSALTAWALSSKTTLEVASRAMNNEVAPRAMAKVLAAIFQTLPVDWRDAEDGDGTDNAVTDDPEERQQKAHTALLILCEEPRVLDALRRIGRVLWATPDAAFRAWAQARLKATLGAALLTACRELYPEAGADQLILDLDPGPRPKGAPAAFEHEIWITEKTLGGGGVLEEILRRFSGDPRRFFRLAESALAASDFELVDMELTRVLELLRTDEDLQACVAAVRNADSHAALQRAVRQNILALEERGVQASHGVLSALHTRVLRPGSAPDSDALLYELICRWREYEEHLGVEVDARVFAYLASSSETLDAVLRRINPDGGGEAQQWRLQVIHSLLWPRGHVIRGQALASYNPFHTAPEADRHLLVDILDASEVPIQLSSPDWWEQVAMSLRTRGIARLTAPPSDAPGLRRALLDLATSPLEVDYLQFYPQVEGLERGANGLTATLYLPESVQ